MTLAAVASVADPGDHAELRTDISGWRLRKFPEDFEAKDPKLDDVVPRSRNETGSTLSLLCSDDETETEDSTTDGNADDIGRCLDDDLLESCASPLSLAGAEPSLEPEAVVLEQESPGGTTSSCVLGALIFFSIACGCACQAPYEVLNSQDKGCAHLISLAEHIFGLLVTLPCAFRKRQLPLRRHLALAAGGIAYTQLQNAALSTKLPTLVLITIKNGNLAANIFLGKVIMKRQYGLQQLAAVLLLSFGLLLLSVVGAGASLSDDAGDHNLWSCILGVLLLAGALLSRAAGALAQ
ncbi:Efr, partial [Symbiodinium microadriaticum]